jgi:G protein beta subunit-like protein
VLKCLLSPDCRLLATTSSDKTVKLWNLDGFKLERVLEGHQRWVWDCVFRCVLYTGPRTTALAW